MKVKIQTNGIYLDSVKMKCSAVEFLVIKQALYKVIDDRAEAYKDRLTALNMLEDIANSVEKKKKDI